MCLLFFFSQDCRSALRVEPGLLRGMTLLGHACLRMGLHAEASQFLHDGLALAMASGGTWVYGVGCSWSGLQYGSGVVVAVEVAVALAVAIAQGIAIALAIEIAIAIEIELALAIAIALVIALAVAIALACKVGFCGGGSVSGMLASADNTMVALRGLGTL